MDKHAQVTVFIIMGVVILSTVGVMYALKNLGTNDVVEESFSFRLDNEPGAFSNYIESCVREEAKPLIKELGLNGGTLSESVFRMYHNISYNYLCLHEHGRGCVNDIRTREYMGDELKRELLERLPLCVDMGNFKDQGYNVVEGEMDLNVIIGTNTVDIVLSYPLKISKEEFNFEMDKFPVLIKSNLGKLYDLAIQILNSEIEDGEFNKDIWMLENGVDVQIGKNKPYPDIIYSLSKLDEGIGEKYGFNFALQGEDTVLQVENPLGPNILFGYCYTNEDKNCYVNSDEGICISRGGEWSSSMPSDCEGVSNYNDGCEDGECNDCGHRKHGETWCEYDSITGNGFDYVGSRHYLRSCFDGRIYYEECRDFREEVCVESNDMLDVDAVCRPNRWQDCVLIHDEAQCKDSSIRDCIWGGSLKKSYNGKYDNDKCYPIVPPGFKHWQSNGFDVCQMANEQNDCDGVGCPQDWVDSSAMYCYHMGDCGAYRNIADFVTTGGFITTNRAPSDFIYLDDGMNDAGQEYVLNLQKEVEPVVLGGIDPYDNQKSDLNEMMREISEYVKITNSWSEDDFIDQYIWEGEVSYWTRHTSFCDVWENPTTSACWKCHEDSSKPCSEYRCKSLGSGCEYETVDGYGRCFDKYSNDIVAPVLDFDATKLSNGLSFNDTFFASYDGWEVFPEFYPYDMVKFGINSSEEIQCKISLIPGIDYGEIPWVAGNFSTEHEFRYRVPDTIYLIEYFKDTMKVVSLINMGQMNEISALFQRIKADAQNTAGEFGVDISNFVQKLTEIESRFNNEIKPDLQSFLNLVQGAINNLMIELESRRHVIFIKCIDRAGNENAFEKIVKFNVKDDSQPPEMIDSEVTILSDIIRVKLRLNEEAECKYSLDGDELYDRMVADLFCKQAFDNDNGFYYECIEDFSPIAIGSTLYIRCRDRPPEMKNYALHFVEDSYTGVLSADRPSLIEINDSFVNVLHDYILLSNDTFISSFYPSMRVGMNFEKSVTCRYDSEQRSAFENYPEQELQCSGQYCEGDFDIYNRSVYIGCINKLNKVRNTNTESMIIPITS